MSLKKIIYISTAIVASATVQNGFAQDQFITIGTGGVTGVYYPTGGAICRLVNKDRKEHGIRCSVESTGGSVYNVRTIREKELDIGIVTSDVQYDAIRGTGQFENDGINEDIRALFSVHPEPMHLMATVESGINIAEDLKGKKVNIGNPGSGTRVLAETLMSYLEFSTDDFSLASELKSSEQAAALCDGKIDATIWAAGLPNGSSQEATNTCAVKIIPLEGEKIEKLLSENRAYSKSVIPGGMYPNNPNDINTWGPKATVVTSAEVSEETVYVLVKAIFDNFEDFKTLHPAFANLKEEDMISDGLTAELHAGAIKYYQEKGWL